MVIMEINEINEINEEAVERAIKVLNRALNEDCMVLSEMLLTRYRCNSALAVDDTVQTESKKGARVSHSVSAMGLINGLFGVDEHGYGPITMIVNDEETGIIEFCRTRHRKES